MHWYDRQLQEWAWNSLESWTCLLEIICNCSYLPKQMWGDVKYVSDLCGICVSFVWRFCSECAWWLIRYLALLNPRQTPSKAKDCNKWSTTLPLSGYQPWRCVLVWMQTCGSAPEFLCVVVGLKRIFASCASIARVWIFCWWRKASALMVLGFWGGDVAGFHWPGRSCHLFRDSKGLGAWSY